MAEIVQQSRRYWLISFFVGNYLSKAARMLPALHESMLETRAPLPNVHLDRTAAFHPPQSPLRRVSGTSIGGRESGIIAEIKQEELDRAIIKLYEEHISADRFCGLCLSMKGQGPRELIVSAYFCIV